MRDALLKALDGREDRALELQAGLTAIPAIAPESGGLGEWDKARWLEDWFKAHGMTHIEHVDAPDPRVPSGLRPNLIVRLPGATPRMLWVLGHLDVVPPGDESLWHSDPWTVTRDAHDPDIIRGRGVEDNQQAVVSAALVAAELVERGITPELGLGIIAVADEETGNAYGAEYLLAQRPDLISADDLVMVPDYGSADGTMVEVAEKGSLWLKVTVTGVQCHASTPDEGKNSLVAAADMILRVREINERYTATDPLFTPSRTTMAPTRHDANVPNVNTIPGKDVFFVDCRILPVYSLDEVLSSFRELAADIAARHGVQVEVEVVNGDAAFPATPVDSPVVIGLLKAMKAVYGLEGRPGGVGGGTVAKFLRAKGIPAAVWARVMDSCHMPDEATRLSFIIGDAKVYAHMLFPAAD